MNSRESGDLDAVAASIQTRQDLVAFLKMFHADLIQSPDEWENNTLPSFLESLAAWTNDLEGAFANQGHPVPETPTWNLIARMLLAARVYE